jgi:hypothetical protein
MSPIIEKHYNVKELIAILGWTRQRVYRNFKHHPEVLRDANRIFVPESVLQEMILRLRHHPGPKPVRRGRPKGSKNKPKAATDAV